MRPRRHRIDWQVAEGRLGAIEPTRDEVVAAGGALAAAYSDPANAPMMGHDEPFTADDVVAHFEALDAEGARPFLLFRDGALAGDADLRGIDGGHAELALMVGAAALKGRGLGTRFAIMIHAFGFRALGLERIFVTIVPGNQPSLRLFTRLGHKLDDGPVARGYADDPSEISMSIGRAEFERAHAAALAEIRIGERGDE